MNDLLHSLIQDARLWQGHKQKETLGHDRTESTGFAALDQQLGGTGWPRGALSECLLDAPGVGELQLVLPLVRHLTTTGKTVFWLNPPHTPYAPALARAGVNLDQVILIHTKTSQDLLWTLENCLRSPVTGLVMAWPGRMAARDIRRLQLAAETGSNLCILFRPRQAAAQSSPAALRLELVPSDDLALQVRVLKRRGGWPGQDCSLAMGSRAGTSADQAARVIHGPWPDPQARE